MGHFTAQARNFVPDGIFSYYNDANVFSEVADLPRGGRVCAALYGLKQPFSEAECQAHAEQVTKLSEAAQRATQAAAKESKRRAKNQQKADARDARKAEVAAKVIAVSVAAAREERAAERVEHDKIMADRRLKRGVERVERAENERAENERGSGTKPSAHDSNCPVVLYGGKCMCSLSAATRAESKRTKRQNQQRARRERAKISGFEHIPGCPVLAPSLGAGSARRCTCLRVAEHERVAKRAQYEVRVHEPSCSLSGGHASTARCSCDQIISLRGNELQSSARERGGTTGKGGRSCGSGSLVATKNGRSRSLFSKGERKMDVTTAGEQYLALVMAVSDATTELALKRVGASTDAREVCIHFEKACKVLVGVTVRTIRNNVPWVCLLQLRGAVYEFLDAVRIVLRCLGPHEGERRHGKTMAADDGTEGLFAVLSTISLRADTCRGLAVQSTKAMMLLCEVVNCRCGTSEDYPDLPGLTRELCFMLRLFAESAGTSEYGLPKKGPYLEMFSNTLRVLSAVVPSKAEPLDVKMISVDMEYFSSVLYSLGRVNFVYKWPDDVLQKIYRALGSFSVIRAVNSKEKCELYLWDSWHTRPSNSRRVSTYIQVVLGAMKYHVVNVRPPTRDFDEDEVDDEAVGEYQAVEQSPVSGGDYHAIHEDLISVLKTAHLYATGECFEDECFEDKGSFGKLLRHSLGFGVSLTSYDEPQDKGALKQFDLALKRLSARILFLIEIMEMEACVEIDWGGLLDDMAKLVIPRKKGNSKLTEFAASTIVVLLLTYRHKMKVGGDVLADQDEKNEWMMSLQRFEKKKLSNGLGIVSESFKIPEMWEGLARELSKSDLFVSRVRYYSGSSTPPPKKYI